MIVPPESVSTDDMISVDEGFQRLLRHFQNSHEAREHYNAGLRANRIRLLAFGVREKAIEPTWNIVDPNWIERHAYVEAQAEADGRGWCAEIAQKGGIGFERPQDWAVSVSDIERLIDEEEAAKKPAQRHPGGKPREYDHDEIRAVAIIALARFLKKGAIPDNYSGNDLAADVRMTLGDRSPAPSTLAEILNPLLQRIKLRLKSSR